MTAALVVLAFVIAAWVVRRLGAQLGGEPAYAKEIAVSISRGDLSNAIRLDTRDRDSMLHALRDMQEGLAGTVREISASAEAIASAAGEIAMGNLDLSQRTEQQAVALERTATSMGQLTSTVHQNAENARQASALAANARVAAGQCTSCQRPLRGYCDRQGVVAPSGSRSASRGWIESGRAAR